MRDISRSSVLLPTLAAAAVLAIAEGDANAATFTVTSSADTTDPMPGNGTCTSSNGVGCTLRAAVVEANALPGLDTIVLPPGIDISLLNTGAGENAASTGDLDIKQNLMIVGNGAEIDGVGNDRIFHVHKGAAVHIQDVVLRDGWGGQDGGGAILNEGALLLDFCTIEESATAQHGGGIKSVTGELVVRWCDITLNEALQGGGIYSSAVLHVENSIIDGNDAGLHGGGIHVAAAPGLLAVILDTHVGDNTATDHGGGIFTAAPMDIIDTIVELNAAGGLGGGLYMNAATVDASRSDFSDNDAFRGGGIYNGGGDLTLQHVGVWGNEAVDGGGIDNRGFLLADRGAIYANKADTGAGIHNYSIDGELLLLNMTVSGNVGGGLWVDATSKGAAMKNVTVVGNTALTTGGISAFASTTLFNTIVADNMTPLGPSDCAGTITSGGYNLIEGSTGCAIAGPATADIYGVGPGVGPLAANGGRTLTHAVQPGSLARNNGNNATCEAVDQRDVSRPQNGTCDIGAYELN